MPTWRGFTAHVMVDGQALEEYGTNVTQDANGTTNITTHIIARDDTPYSICFDFDQSVLREWDTGGLNYRLFVDGEATGNHVYQGGKATHMLTGRDIGDKLYPFRFGSLDHNQQPAAGAPTPALHHPNKIGSLILEVWRVNTSGPSRPGSAPQKNPLRIHGGAAPKKAVLLSHCTRYGDAVPARQRRVIGCTYIDSVSFLTIEMKYRSRELLEAEGLVERPEPQHDANDIEAEPIRINGQAVRPEPAFIDLTDGRVLPDIKRSTRIIDLEANDLKQEVNTISLGRNEYKTLLDKVNRLEGLLAGNATAGSSSSAAPFKIGSEAVRREPEFIDLTDGSVMPASKRSGRSGADGSANKRLKREAGRISVGRDENNNSLVDKGKSTPTGSPTAGSLAT
ncbi:hypothetical protein DFJ77DRAFT_74829 [Powellomyces hirtus]|nr:hypothetical protein DFJ77DRAFT_74829 [Powellomyces hirtus]